MTGDRPLYRDIEAATQRLSTSELTHAVEAAIGSLSWRADDRALCALDETE
jgi:hypothetical protein